MRPTGRVGWTAIALCLASAGGVAGEPGDYLGLSLEQLANVNIVTAARVPETLARTSSTVSVITAEQLRRSGARTIYDALAQLPGLTIGIGQFGENTIALRGLRTSWSEKVLILLDGHLLNDARSGSATYQFLDSLPVDNIARIEVVRGPGSALYGANAFLGVINIITRAPEEIGGVQATASVERESSRTAAGRYNLLAGGALSGDWQGGVNINVLNAAGPHLPVATDAFGRSGEADTHQDRVDTQAILTNGALTLRARYLKREAGDYFGPLGVLNGQSDQRVEYGFLDAEYREHVRAGDWRLRAYVDRQHTDNYYVGAPAGSIPPTNPFFPWNGVGVIAESLARETVTGAETQFDYREFHNHTVTAGLAWRRERLYHPRYLANYDSLPPTAPLPGLTDVSGYFNWISPARRDIASVFAQDLWVLADSLRATLGARYDHYSDFGSTFNPRLGLVWQATPRVDARLTYGSAFRAPSFYEQHVMNNPVFLGNPGLDPEKIRTLEAGTRVAFSQNLHGELTLFHSALSNLIDQSVSSAQYQNVGSVTVNGIETEAIYEWQRGTRLCVNYSFADPDFNGREPSVQAPRHSANVITGFAVANGLTLNLNAHWQSQTARATGDTRAPLDGYLLVNTALTSKLDRYWDMSLAVFNVADTRYAYAAPANTVPGDYTAPGRSVVIGIRYAR